jgi:uncharacterized protein YjeT (DUF2065 family)
MKELILAFGLLFFIEGLIIAIFPSRIKIMLKLIESIPENKLRLTGIISIIFGFIIVWYIKS